MSSSCWGCRAGREEKSERQSCSRLLLLEFATCLHLKKLDARGHRRRRRRFLSLSPLLLFLQPCLAALAAATTATSRSSPRTAGSTKSVRRLKHVDAVEKRAGLAESGGKKEGGGGRSSDGSMVSKKRSRLPSESLFPPSAPRKRDSLLDRGRLRDVDSETLSREILAKKFTNQRQNTPSRPQRPRATRPSASGALIPSPSSRRKRSR